MNRDEILHSIVAFLLLLVFAIGLLFLATNFPPAVKNPEIAGALLGAIGTIFAAWIAWRVVERQLEATNAQSIAERAAAMRSVASDTMTIGYQLFTANPAIEPLIDSARARVPAVDAVSVVLGGYLRLALDEATRMTRKSHTPVSGSRITHVISIRAVSFRLRILAAAIGQASDDFLARREVSHTGLVASEEALETATECETSLGDLAYLSPVIKT